MSQHLITQFIHRSHLFSPFKGEKIVSHKLKKYDASNRKNNNSPADIAESLHGLAPKRTKDNKSKFRIDITV